MSEGSEKARRASLKAPKATQSQVSLRVQQVYSFLRDGQRTQDIYKLCAIQREREIKARADWRNGSTDARGVRIAEPINAWGDDEMPKTRQLDEYIRKAKLLIAAEGRELSKKGELVLGTTFARINDLYARALADKKYHACARLIEISIRLFGLDKAVAVQLLPDVPNEGKATTAQKVAAMTPESAFFALSEIASRALARARAQGQLEGVSVEQIMLGAPVKVIEHEPSTNGDKR
jgi:hypothetical protein